MTISEIYVIKPLIFFCNWYCSTQCYISNMLPLTIGDFRWDSFWFVDPHKPKSSGTFLFNELVQFMRYSRMPPPCGLKMQNSQKVSRWPSYTFLQGLVRIEFRGKLQTSKAGATTRMCYEAIINAGSRVCQMDLLLAGGIKLLEDLSRISPPVLQVWWGLAGKGAHSSPQSKWSQETAPWGNHSCRFKKSVLNSLPASLRHLQMPVREGLEPQSRNSVAKPFYLAWAEGQVLSSPDMTPAGEECLRAMCPLLITHFQTAGTSHRTQWESS